MAHVNQAERNFPQTAFYVFATALMAAAVTVIVALSALGPIRLGPISEPIQISPALAQAGRQWELEHKQQSGYVDPVIDYGRDWEKQRRQQSAF